MSLNIEQEIARRLGVDVEAVTPAMEAVIQRIRQQVAHYGYARLAGIGTFRQQDGEFTFEADPTLADSVNHRFGGLEPLAVESSAPASGYQKHELFHAEAPAPSEPQDADEPEEPVAGEPGGPVAEEPQEPFGREPQEPFGREPQEPYDRESQGPFDQEPQGPFDREPQEPFDQEPQEPFDREAQGPLAEEPQEPGGEEPREPFGGERRTGESEEGPWDQPEDPWTPETGDQPAERYWEPPREAEEEHPLGPLSGPRYEEADFSYVPEGEEAPGDETFEEEEPFVRYEEPEFDETEEEDVPSEEAVVGPPLGVEEAEQHPEYEDEPPEPTVRWNPAAEFTGEEEELKPPPEEPPYVRTAWAQPPDPEPEPADTWEEPEPEPEMESEAEAEADATAPPPASTIRQRHERPVQRGPSRFAQEQERSRVPWIAGGVVILLAIAATAVYLMLRGPAGTGDATGDMTGIYPPVPTDTLIAGGGADTTAVADEVPIEEPEEAEPEETGPLYGDAIDEDAGGWTLVAASETSEAAAERAAERFREERFRTGVLAGTSGGVTRYRVGVGQFTSLAEAEQYRDDLAGDVLPGDAWVLRIR